MEKGTTKIIFWSVTALILIGGGYYGYTLYAQSQKEKKEKEEEKKKEKEDENLKKNMLHHLNYLQRDLKQRQREMLLENM
jgi:uncharacterized protein YcbK (DUF882 family)